MNRYLSGLFQLSKALATDPEGVSKALHKVPTFRAGYRFASTYEEDARIGTPAVASSATNPLWEYFQGHDEGHGIWKWEHYFEVYHRHLARFVGRPVDVMEIGIFSGGSLEMWRSYFGDRCHIYGVDIEEACRAYENEHTTVLIGDQADRAFWSRVKKDVAGFDVVVDDGGHTLEQQQATLEELLPHLRPGGVYICEDVHGSFNGFASFAAGLVAGLNADEGVPGPLLQSKVSRFQASVHSIHFYPFVVVIEKHLVPPARMAAPRHGTKWQPHL